MITALISTEYNPVKISTATIRYLSPDDELSVITDLVHAAYASRAEVNLNYWATHQSIQDTAKRFALGQGLIAELDGKIVGTLMIRPAHADSTVPLYRDPTVWTLNQFGVLPELQGCGIGRQLHDAALEHAKNHGGKVIALDTAAPATELIEMYCRWGYSVVGECDWRPKTNYLSIIMSRQIEKPPHQDFPDYFETERLLIRAPRMDDGKVVFQGVSESLSELRAWPASLPWAMNEPSIASSEAFCRTGLSAFFARTDFPMLMFLKSDGNFVGAIGLHKPDWVTSKFEIGYWCCHSYQGRGLGTEAVKGIAQWGFSALGARQLSCLTDTENTPSRRVLEKAGFSLEDILSENRTWPDGTLRSTCVYSLCHE